MNYKKIGQNIRKERQKSNLTIEQAAMIIGISSNYLGKIERGQSKMSMEALVKIANGLNLTSDDILDQELKNISHKRLLKTNSNLNILAYKHPDYYKLIEIIIKYALDNKE